MSRIVILGIVILSLCGPMASGFAAESVAETFQKALVEEEANQNLEAAIKAYQNVIAQLDEQRRMTATAIFRLGECYRKLGQTNEAAAQYQRILAEFKDQATLTGLSSQNLQALGMLPVFSAQKDPATQIDPMEKAEIGQLQGLLQTSPDLINEADPEGKTRLHRAAEAGQISVVQFLLKNGARVDVRTKSGFTPLHSAIRKGNLRIVELLVQAGISVNAASVEGITSLHLAAAYGHNAIADFLIRNGANVNLYDKTSGNTPLMSAAIYGFRAVAETLVRAGADVNAQSPGNKKTALHEAAIADQADFIDFLISNGANPDLVNHQGFTPLHLAVGAEQESAVEALLRYPVKVDYPIAGSTQMGPDIRPQKSRSPLLLISGGSTALHVAVTTGNRRIVELLLENGADVHAQTDNGETALEFAVASRVSPLSHKDIEIVKLLFRKGADANLHSKNHRSPLAEAIMDGNLEMVKILIENKVNVDGPSVGARPISFAIGSDRPDYLSLLLKGGANPNFRTDRGTTPLHDAVEYRNKQAVAVLLEHGADVNAVNAQGVTPIEQLRDALMPWPLNDFVIQSPGPGGQQTGLRMPGWNKIDPSTAERIQTASQIARMLQRRGAAVPWIGVAIEDSLWIAFDGSPTEGSRHTPAESLVVVIPRLKTAPKLSSLKLFRKGMKEPLVFDLRKAIEEGDCKNDELMKLGDVLEVEYETDFTVLSWPQMPNSLASKWSKCLRRTITVDINGEKTTVECWPTTVAGTSSQATAQLQWDPAENCALKSVLPRVIDQVLKKQGLSRQDLGAAKIIVKGLNKGDSGIELGYNALPTSSIILDDGDIIQIRKVLNSQPSSNEGGKAFFTGQVKGSEVVWAANERKTLFEALVEVGYHTLGAKLSSVQLDRIDPVTKESRVIVVDVQKIIKGDRSEDIVLQPGDRIHVPKVLF